jgi:WD40 repeat protein
MEIPQMQEVAYVAVSALAFSPDGATLAVGREDGSVVLRNVATWRKFRTLKLPTPPWRPGENGMLWRVDNYPISLSFSAATGQLAASGMMGDVTVWDIAAGKRVHLSGFGAGIGQVLFHPKEPSLALLDSHGAVRLWDVRAGKQQWRTVIPGGSASNILLRTLLFDASGQRLVVCASWQDQSSTPKAKAVRPRTTPQVTLLDSRTGRVLGGFAGPPTFNSVTLSTDGRLLVAARYEAPTTLADKLRASIETWELGSGKQLKRIAIEPASRLVVAASPGAGQVAVVGGYGELRILDLANGATVYRGDEVDLFSINTPSITPDGKKFICTITRETADQPWLAIGGWNLETGGLAFIQKVAGRSVNSLAMAADGRTLALAISPSGDGAKPVIELRDSETGAGLRQLVGPAAEIKETAFSPDGTQFAALGVSSRQDLSYRVFVWNATTGQFLRSFPVKQWASGNISVGPHFKFTSDGKQLMFPVVVAGAGLGERDGIQFVDASTGKPVKTLDGGYMPVFTPDGKRFARVTGVRDGMLGSLGSAPSVGALGVFDAQSGRRLAVIGNRGREEEPLFWRPDGSLVTVTEKPENNDSPMLGAGYPGGRTYRLRTWNLSTPAEPTHSVDLAGEMDGISPVTGMVVDELVREDFAFVDWATGKEVAKLSLMSPTDSAQLAPDWLIYTPDDAFDASSGAQERILWQSGDIATRDDARTETRHRPELVGRALSGGKG